MRFQYLYSLYKFHPERFSSSLKFSTNQILEPFIFLSSCLTDVLRS